MNIKYYKCPKRSILLPEITVAALYAAAVVVLCVIFTPFSMVFNWIFFPLTVIAVFYELIYFPLYMKSVKFSIGENEIGYQSGVFVNRRRFMSRERVVFVSLIKTPFTPLLRIVVLRIMATGSMISALFVSKSDAQEIISVLSPELKQ